MSWILKSKRLQSASHGANNNTGSSGLHSNSIYSQSTNNLSSSSLNSSSACEFGNNNNLSSSVSFNNTASAQSLSSHPHHLDAGDDMVRQLNTQKTSFMRWVNVQLANAAASANNNINNNKSNNSNNTNLGTSSSTKSISPSISATTTSTISNIYTPMTSIELDLRDGKRLVALLEEVSKEPLKPERGNMRIHQIANVSKALKFLEERTDEPLGSIGTEDIVDGKLKLTLGLLWIIIYRFQIQQIANTMTDLYPFLATEDILEGDDGTKGKKKGTSQQVDAKQALLRWVRYQLEDYSDVIPPIQDFHRSWRTGLAFAALIHRHDPEFLPQFYSSILPLPFETSDEWRQTLTTAFEVGLEKMKVPRLLEPEDLVDVETPDERSVMTYVTEYYIVMSKHQMEQDPAVAAELHRLRLQAKDGRLALAGEDEQARRFRLQAEESRRKREEEEELERIRLKRMEIEGWSVRAAERAREEEEALRKRREEEEERRLQRKLRREQHEREKSQLLQQQQGSEADLGSGANAGSGVGMDHPSSDHSRHDADILSASSVLSDSERDHSDTETGKADPEEQEKRQRELGEKLAEYHQGIGELTAWVREQDTAFPPSPDMTSLLDRVRDLEPLMETIKVVEEEQAIKEHIMSHLHDVREELLEYENPDLAPEQISEMDKKWWELETIWTSLTNKVVNGKDTAEEIKWIIDCSQEIGRVNGEISKFEAQLEAFAEKRSHETPQERCEKHVLEQQDVSLSSISFLLKTYVDFLTALMDPKVHHYTAPEHLTALNNELTTVRLPRLGIVIEKAQQNLANDRLLRKFFDSFVLSEAWIGESVEWLANIEVPIFVTHDQWNGATTVKEYITRDVSQDLDLEYYQAEIDELEGELKDEQSEVTMFRSSGFAKLDEQAKAVMKSVVETQDVTAEETTKAVQKLMKGVMSNLEKVEKLLPKEAEHCAYAARVLDYLWEARTTLMELEQASTAINKWEMRQPDSEIEVFVIQVEEQFNTLDLSITNERSQPTVREAVQNRHAGLTSVVRNLRTYFEQKQEAIKGDRKMKEFLELTLTCQATLQNFKTKLQGPAPMTGFGLNDTKPFDDFATMVLSIGKAIENFEKSEHVSLVEMGALVTTMSATSSLKQDSTVIQNKLQSVNRLLKETKDLRGDRERDSATMTGCRKLAASLVALDSDLNKLQADFTALEDLEPSQRDDLIELGHRSNQLRSQYVLLEQDSVYCHLVQDPSCSKLLEDIASLQISIQQTQERLQSRLELKQQWDLAWEAFYNCTDSLQGYLNDQEREVIVRDIFALDSLSPDEAIWRKTEDYIHSAEVANEETLSRLKEFETTRLPELIDLQGVLKKAVESAGGLEKLDVNRARRSRKAEVIPKNLTEHLNDIYAMNADDKSLLDTLRKRQLWAQHFTESTAEVDALKDSCLNAICEYTAILKPCERSGDTA
ncbi:actinin alpha 2, partial [Lobosporangium transversale]